MLPTKPLLLRSLVWLPVCFLVWYLCAVPLTSALAACLSIVLTNLLPEVFEGVERTGRALSVLTQIETGQVMKGLSERIAFELDALKYSYSMPLYTTLVLAAPAERLTKLTRWLVGMAILAAALLLGVAAEALKIVGFGLGEAGSQALDLSQSAYIALALSYQLGFLILPSALPIVIWLTQWRDAFADLLRDEAH